MKGFRAVDVWMVALVIILFPAFPVGLAKEAKPVNPKNCLTNVEADPEYPWFDPATADEGLSSGYHAAKFES